MKHLLLSAAAALFLLIAVVSLATATSVAEITFESSTRCAFERPRTSLFSVHSLSPDRRRLFEQAMVMAVNDYAAEKPQWFVNSAAPSCDSSSSNNDNGLTADPMAQCLLFLVQFLPEIDRQSLTIGFILDNVQLALRARDTFRFAKDVPWHLFLNDVLPYSVLSERRGPWRRTFFDFFTTNENVSAQLLNISSVAKAASWMNGEAYNMPVYMNKHGAKRIVYFECQCADCICGYSPLEVLHRGNASCTGLSMFLTSCLRSVGIPARIAGTPHWNLGRERCPHGDASPACGDHSWTESNAGGGWSFQDSDATVRLNHSWFVPFWTEHQTPLPPGGKFVNHSIFASSWAPSDFILSTFGGDQDPLARPFSWYPMVWNFTTNTPPNISKISSAWDVTRRYLTFNPK